MRRWWYFVVLAVFALVFLSACRMAFFYINNHELVHNPPMKSMLIGLQFDISVIAYWLSPAFVLHLVQLIAFKKESGPLRWIANAYIIIGFFTIMLICVADIGYYKFYYNHINSAALNWANTPAQVLKMLWGESLFRWGIAAVLTATLLFVFIHSFISKKSETHWHISTKRTLGYVILTTGFFLAMRGGLRAKPLHVLDSKYSRHHFFNQVALSPVYSFYQHSASGGNLYRKLSATEEESFLKLRSEKKEDESFVFGIPSISNKPNVMFVLMEGMATWKLKYAPFLDSFKNRCIYFDSFYSTGEHTYNGIISALYGEPAILGKHMLRWMESAPIYGLPYWFRQNGYRTIFQIPHSRSFDNMNGFFWRHHYDTLTDISVMPKDKQSKCVWGTSDHLYLDYVLDNMTYLTQKRQPVFSTVLTVSDHTPYFFPEHWKGNKNNTAAQNIVAYADWSLRRFFEKASKTDWFKNTVFVIVADHGGLHPDEKFPLPLSLHHVPCMIYFGSGKCNPIAIHKLASQTDLLPTIADMFQWKLTKDYMGFNLFKEKRPGVVISSDSYYGLIHSNGYTLTDEYGNFQHFGTCAELKNSEERNRLQQYLMQNIQYMNHRAEKLTAR